MLKCPKVNVDILVIKEGKVLLGELTERWSSHDKYRYGAPGRDLLYRETIAHAVKRSIDEDLGVLVTDYKIICVNANRALNNHYVGIGVLANTLGLIKNKRPDDWKSWNYFDVHKLPDKLFPPAKNLIQCYLESKVCASE